MEIGRRKLRSRVWCVRGKELPVGDRTVVMGILNVTPDSFSDGGRNLESARAVAHALEMLDAGADIIDIGGESSRPGSEPVPADLEIRRVLPVIEGIRARTDAPLSLDTWKPEVARRGLDAGVDVLNDITGLSHGPEIARMAGEIGAGLVIMHMRGTPGTMQTDTQYGNLVSELVEFLKRQVRTALEAGVSEEALVVDPGIGFGKSVDGNLEIIRCLGDIAGLGYPVLLGTSRKGFIGGILDRPVNERIWGTAATVALGIAYGASIVRVHDVAEMVEVARMTDAVLAKRCGH